jgi:hypothetical protein
MTMRSYLKRSTSVTPSQIINEGVVELGRIGSIAFVLTHQKLRLFHADAIPYMDTPYTRPAGLVVSAIDVGCG